MTTTIDGIQYLTDQEAAALLGLTPGTVRTYSHDGRGTLRTTKIAGHLSMLSLDEVRRFKRDRAARLKADRRGSYRRKP
jgi:predicted transcriptional regulator